MELLVCMSIAGSIPVVICLLLYIIQRGNYNYILGRRLLLTGVFFYLVPVQLVKYLLPKDALPETMLIGRKADSYMSGSLAFWSEKQGEYIWIPQWFNLICQNLVNRNYYLWQSMRLLNTGEVHILYGTISLKRLKIQKIISPII